MRAFAALLLVLASVEQRQRDVGEQLERGEVLERLREAAANLSAGGSCTAAGPCAACAPCAACPETEIELGWVGVAGGHLASALLGQFAVRALGRHGAAAAEREFPGPPRQAMLVRGVRE